MKSSKSRTEAELQEKRVVIARVLQALQYPSDGYRWDSDSETLFLLSEGKEIETGEFGPDTLSRNIMRGIEDFFVGNQVSSHTTTTGRSR